MNELESLPAAALAVWPESQAFMRSTELVAAIAAVFPGDWSEESGWGRDLTVQRFGRFMNHKRGIKSRKNNLDQRGYLRSDIESALEGPR